MAVMEDCEPIAEFSDWYDQYEIDSRDGSLRHATHSKSAALLRTRFRKYKSEMDARVANYDTFELLADGQVISPKPDLPNVSSGETAGLVRRIARNLVQNTPNVEVISKFDDDSVEGRFVSYILKSRVIGSDSYSNDMQQNLMASTKTSLTLGFNCVIPVLLQDRNKSWYMQYDSIHYRDVFPEPGCKDVRRANEVFIRRYLTRGDVISLIRSDAPGWDPAALKSLLQENPGPMDQGSGSLQDKKHKVRPDGYSVITWYSSSGDKFLTFSERSGLLLRMEVNKHPTHQHPVFFLVLEKDDQQPLGKSQVEFLTGRQDFQDLMLNGAMKLWYRNINPTIIGYGGPNAVPNLGPGKYAQISNPNARLEPFEVNTQTLMQYGSISQQNLGSMVSLLGSADQQMATQAGNGMSATPQGVEAQQQMVDITTNNYQKAVEAFFSHYCSYALTLYFQELKSIKKIAVSADTRRGLVEAGLSPDAFNDEGELEIDFSKLAVDYFVRCIPGTLVELEDEKQLRQLNELFVPLSQAMPALAATQNQDMVMQAAQAMHFIIGKQIELSGAGTAKDIGLMWNGETEEAKQRTARIQELDEKMSLMRSDAELELDSAREALVGMDERVSLLTENMGLLLEKLGVTNNTSGEQSNSSEELVSETPVPTPTI